MASTEHRQATDQTHGQRLRYAICGLSNRAIHMYVPALTGDSPYTWTAGLAAVVEADPARLAAFLERQPGDLPGYAAVDFDRMLTEVRPDAVIVTTPDGAHVGYIVGALQRGVDVITEKPMVIDAAQARAVLDAEAKSTASVRVTHNTRYTQANMAVKRMILDGMVGRITNVEMVWNIDTYHGSSYFYRWNRDRAMSGGMSITKGSHHFDLLNWWIGDVPQQVFAYGALNYYGANSPYNPAPGGTVQEQRARDPYRLYWSQGERAPEDDHLKSTRTLPNPLQYPDDKPIYIYDAEIAIEDTYSAVIRYRGGASVAYSTNFSAPWEGYTVGINGTKGRIESTFYAIPSRCPFPATERQPITYFPMFGQRQVHETRAVGGGHGGADPLLLRNLFGTQTPEYTELGLEASSRDGAYAVAIGEAVWRSVEENRPIDIADLLGLNQSLEETRS